MRCISLYLGCFLVFGGLRNTSGDFAQQLIGCYSDSEVDRAMGECVESETSISMTLDRCAILCRNVPNTFFGVQLGEKCFCADQYNKHGLAKNCDMECVGDTAQICGGANALSVYKVCPVGFYGSGCLDACRADCDGFCFMNGTCQCPAGWTGLTCQTDVDECSRGYCGQTCKNTPGSFTCGCRPGYTLGNNKRNCLDVDECRTSTHGCQHKCTNTLGSYSCSCFEGYDLDADNRNCTYSPSWPSGANAAAVVLGIGCLVAIIALAVVGWLLFRARRTRDPKSKLRTQANNSDQTAPYFVTPTTDADDAQSVEPASATTPPDDNRYLDLNNDSKEDENAYTALRF